MVFFLCVLRRRFGKFGILTFFRLLLLYCFFFYYIIFFLENEGKKKKVNSISYRLVNIYTDLVVAYKNEGNT